RWMIDGCLAWQREGLNPPASVRAATESYFESEDAVGQWIAECATEDPDAFETTRSLFTSWRRWAEAAGEYAGSEKRFRGILEDRGFRPHRKNTGRGFYGLRLFADD